MTGAVPVFNHVATAVATGSSTVAYDWDLPNPAIPNGIDLDVPDGYHAEVALDGNTANNAARSLLIELDGSAEESAVWEQVANTEGISTVTSLQLANEKGIPIFNIDQANEKTYIPELTLGASTVAAIQAKVNAGATVTSRAIPRRWASGRGSATSLRSARAARPRWGS